MRTGWRTIRPMVTESLLLCDICPAAAESFDKIDAGGQPRPLEFNSAALLYQRLSLRGGHVKISDQSGLVTIVCNFHGVLCCGNSLVFRVPFVSQPALCGKRIFDLAKRAEYGLAIV